MTAEANNQTNVETIICHECIANNDPDAHFCIQCGAPLSSHAATDPLLQIHATGYMYAKAVNKPTKFIMVLGIWLIFAPTVLTILIFLILLATGEAQFANSNTAASTLRVILILALVVLYLVILFRITHKYQQRSKRIRLAELGLCPNCRYDLRGSIGNDSCPECGEKLTWDEDHNLINVTE